MRLSLVFAVPLIAAPLVTMAAPAHAEERFFSYDPANSAARLMTRGITLQVERGLFGGTRVERLFATAGAGSAGLERGGPDGGQWRAALPAGASETNAYRIAPEGTGAALGRVLCPGATEVWLVFGRVRPLRDITVQAIGRGQSGQILHCQTLEYRYRGEWDRPVDRSTGEGAGPPSPRG